MPQGGPDPTGAARSELWLGIVFCSAAVLLGALLARDALDGEIRIGGNRGGRVEVIRLDTNRTAFVANVAWLSVLIGAIGLAGGFSIYRYISARQYASKSGSKPGA
jgi:hypothetical protein